MFKVVFRATLGLLVCGFVAVSYLACAASDLSAVLVEPPLRGQRRNLRTRRRRVPRSLRTSNTTAVKVVQLSKRMAGACLTFQRNVQTRD